MLRFNKLRLSGFKSFVEPTELYIEPGLTGVVGPNGCGKSNLVEALRWVMGETSAKKMRGGEMDDVIFGGTADRPSRNIAEVVLSLDNTDRTAPAQFNDHAELEVGRRIERDSGSQYRINGKEVRARDVQLLFADAATGAHSTAMVSQGRVSAIIAAKPIQRRAILEEAAGITGLHSRRHEAELRLRGAETNLERLDDVLVTLDVQLRGLRKQARQASRYRNLSGHIRRAEATLFLLRWRLAGAAQEVSRRELEAALAQVAELTRRASAATTRQAGAAAELPALRQNEAEAAAELQRLTLARDGLDAEERRNIEARADCEDRLHQVAADWERETALAADAATRLQALEAEHTTIEAAREGESGARDEATRNLDEANGAVDELEARLTALTEKVATDEARGAELSRAVEDLRGREGRLTARAAEIMEQRAALKAEAVDPGALARGEGDADRARADLERRRELAAEAEQARAATAEALNAAVSAQQAAEADLTRLGAEEQALAEVLETPGDGDERYPPLLDSVTVEPGYEAALGAALGEDLSAPADEAAPVRWRTLMPFPRFPSLPGTAQALRLYVKGPAALTRRLSQIGVVADEHEAVRLADQLTQGQRLTTKNGGLWRWDGFTVTAGAATATAKRLEQQNRLGAVRGLMAGAGEHAATAESRRQAAHTAAAAADEAEKTARAAMHAADANHAEAREALAAIKERVSEYASRQAALDDAAAAVDADLKDAEVRATEAARELKDLPDTAAARGEIETLRGATAERRSHQAECRAAHDRLVDAAETRTRRLGDIGREVESWRQRSTAAAQQLEHLSERQQSVSADLERLADAPERIARQRGALLDTIEAAEGKRKAAADRLAEAEERVAEADRTLRAVEADLAQAREERVRTEGAVEQADQACEGLTVRIRERLALAPEDLAEAAELDAAAELPELDAVEKRLERLERERETMGPVNLRAEQEAGDLGEQIDTMQSERDDLIRAIEKLRQGISELNREGRKRLLASFAEVDRHFQELFVRLFGGGRAHLTLTESDDPLEAGLEIMASPPGKRLQILSLLSGGEQALTALALLFAVFLTNPAPICVLDEVDAPLDDANVDRVCGLLEDMAASGSTRILIITHHRMTMARMDRLYGVTMAERGVSQLVSVDLKRAETLRATA